jgi:nucleotide-binding universal stress UspA family protein
VKEDAMKGTLLCAVTEGDESQEAVALGAELSERLGLRLVLGHAFERARGSYRVGAVEEGETVTTMLDRRIAERRLIEMADHHGVAERAERRIAVGEPAALLAQIAAEEAADVIVVGARARGWRGRLESSLADRLERETPIPVLIAPPRGSVRDDAATNGGQR